MKGSIRFIVGFLVVFGAVGGIEQSVSTSALLAGIICAAFGLGLMAAATQVMNSTQC